jgi:prophage regulatory protein
MAIAILRMAIASLRASKLLQSGSIPGWSGNAQRERRMAHTQTPIPTILRRNQVEDETGYSRSTIYLRIAQGLWPKPVSLGPRSVGWPATEVAALNAARIAGQSDDEIRALVAHLVAGRRRAGRQE